MAFRNLLLLLFLAFPALPALATDFQKIFSPKLDKYEYSKNVPLEARVKAQKLYSKGTELLKQSLFLNAADEFQKALDTCNCPHPAIHYQLGLALIGLEQPLRVHKHLKAAIRYGPEPIGKEQFANAQRFLALLNKQLSQVAIYCDVPGAQVTMDGKVLFVAPGSYVGLATAGAHTFAAIKNGYAPNILAAHQLPEGKATKINLKLATVEEMTGQARRWPQWKPWSVVAGGAVLLATGGVLHYVGAKKVNSVEDDIQNSGGSFKDQRKRGFTLQKTAVGFYAAGGVALVTGTVLVLMNQPKPVLKQYEVNVSPILTTAGPGAGAQINF
jgi:hypothetical protein